MNPTALVSPDPATATASYERLGIEVESFFETANTFAVFLRRPDDVRIEYVEQKPTFALA